MTITRKNKKLIVFPFLIFFLFLLSCSDATPKEIKSKDLQSGDICSIVNDSTSFGVLKILAIDDTIFHVKFFRNKYSQRPVQIGITELSMEPDTTHLDFGIPHLAVTKKSFLYWQPEFIANEKVTTEELVPYKQWMDSQIETPK